MPQVQRVKQMASEPRINPRKGVVRQSGVGKDHNSRNQGVQNVCGTGGSSNPFYSIGLFSFHFSSTLGKRGLRLDDIIFTSNEHTHSITGTQPTILD